jgi:Ca2+-binding RTX toxin-like protein
MNEVNIPRSAGILTVLVVLLVALTTSVAFAATISCPNRTENLCVGTDGHDDMQGSDENDIMRGYGGNDTMIAGFGNDTAHGSDGNDRIEGRIGDDFLSGGEGADYILTADGRDEAYGAGGNDTIRAYRDDQPDFVSCGAGNADTADVQSGDYVDGNRAGLLVGTTVLSCEKVIVNGVVVIDRTGDPDRQL